VSPGRGKPRRVKRSPAARLRPFRMMIALAGGLLSAGVAYFTIWPGFYPKHLYVTGNRQVSRDEILRRAAFAADRSIWLQDTRGASARIEAIPFIASASIHRLPPDSLTIAVRERVPYAVLQAGGESALADRALRVLALAPDNEQLPVFVLRSNVALVPGRFVAGADAIALRKTYEVMASKGLAPKSVALDRYGDVDAELPDGLHLLLGSPENLGEKAVLANAILAQVVRRQRRVSALDLRAPSTPVIVYR
jgi:cell division septal protein FtsQ